MNSWRGWQHPARVRDAVAGALAAAAALAVGELLAGPFTQVPSPVEAVGGRVIDRVPAPVKDAAIALFGTADKAVLVIGVLVLSLAAGAALGVLWRRRPLLAVAGFAAFGAVGFAAANADPRAAAVASLLVLTTATASGVAVLAVLARAAHAEASDDVATVATADRRRFLVRSAWLAGCVAAAGGVGRLLAASRRTVQQRAAVALPATTAAAALTGRGLDVDGVSPLYTPNSDFYRIDTALSVPQIDLVSWRLRVHGMVDRPFELTFDDLLGMPLEEIDVTLCCVSNPVGGDLVGNARWTGVAVAHLLERAGSHVHADQLVGRAVDGWTAGLPTAVAVDGRPALVAVGMNGEPLPPRHGFPARLVVAGLYGYVSATKWLTELELTTWDGFDAYWVPRGWSKTGPVKAASRIDVPRHGARIRVGEQTVAGVAWAQPNGVADVQVRVDDGPWDNAELGEALSDHTWRQWRYNWAASTGQHMLTVRMVDGNGAVQTAEERPPAPDGATGLHRIRVNVAE